MDNDVVIIQLDRPRKLQFTYSALKELASMTGLTIEKLDHFLSAGFNFESFDKIEAIVYCGLKKDARENGETLKLEQISELLDHAPNFMHIMESVVKAWIAAFPVSGDSAGNQLEPEEKQKKTDSTSKKASA